MAPAVFISLFRFDLCVLPLRKLPLALFTVVVFSYLRGEEAGRGNVNDENNRRGMVNIFLRAIYLYDDRMTLILNGGDRPITIDDILLDEIEEHFEVAVSSHAECSSLVAVAPPQTGYKRCVYSRFLIVLRTYLLEIRLW